MYGYLHWLQVNPSAEQFEQLECFSWQSWQVLVALKKYPDSHVLQLVAVKQVPHPLKTVLQIKQSTAAVLVLITGK